MPAAKVVHIFISSPSDVRAERLIAARVIQRLDREFAYRGSTPDRHRRGCAVMA
jgi:hypothetical protein